MNSLIRQVSGDDQRRLCSENTKLESGPTTDPETGISLGLGLTLTTYGSVTYQLKDANMESSGTCDFVWRALRIVVKTCKYLATIRTQQIVKEIRYISKL